MNNTSVQNQGGWEVNGGHLETSTPELRVQVLFYMLTTQWRMGRAEKGMILGQQTCTLALRQLRQTMRWRLWDSNNPSVRAKGRWEEDTERVRGKTRRGSGAGEEMKECHQYSLVSVHSQLPLLCITDIELRRPSKALGKCVTGPPVLSQYPTPPMNLSKGVRCSSVPHQNSLWSFAGAAGPHHGGTGNAAASMSNSGAWTRDRVWLRNTWDASLTPFPPSHKLSAATGLVMETPAHSSIYHSPHLCVRRDLTSFDYSWTTPHLWSPSSLWPGPAAAEEGIGQAELAQPSLLSALKTPINNTKAINS